MNYLRSLLFLIGQIVTTVIHSINVSLFAWLLPPIARAKFVGVWAQFMQWWIKVMLNLDYEVIGTENLPDHPAVVLSNHQSAWETIMFQNILPPQTHLIKRELLWIPFFGWAMAVNLPIAIDRSKKTSALSKLVSQGKDRLAKGRWIIVYPEGTRMPYGQLGTYQAGGAYLACKTGAPIVPIVHNSGKYWPKSAFLKKPGTIRVVIGPTIPTAGRKPKEVNQEVADWARATLSDHPDIA